MGMAEFQDDDFTRIIELTPALRRRIERAIESLVALLDTYDGDADDEPTLGAPERHPRSEERHLWAGVYEPHLLEPGVWPVRHVPEANQELWAQGSAIGDECEPDGEQDLGSIENHAQFFPAA